MIIKELPPPSFKSPFSVVELVRGVLDLAQKETITYLEINYKISGDPSLKSKSIVTKYD